MWEFGNGESVFLQTVGEDPELFPPEHALLAAIVEADPETIG
ncbi:hypothetical protein [Salinirubellus litoreus]